MQLFPSRQGLVKRTHLKVVCVRQACKGAGLPREDAEGAVKAGGRLFEHAQLAEGVPQRCDGRLRRCTRSHFVAITIS